MKTSAIKKNKPRKKHFELLDVYRGFAIFLMFVYHFSYDLNYYGFIQQHFTQDPFWTSFRTLIVTLFLIIMGISLYLASYQGLQKKHFKRRLLLLLFYASLVSIGSWIMFPKAMILFGILHFIAAASILGLLFIRLGKINLILGFILIVVSQNFSFAIFDQPALQWFGLTTKLPFAVDYVPLLPWFGVVLIGIYLGDYLSQQPTKPFINNLKKWNSVHPINKLLALAGRHSLHIYILHQPLFLGILYIIKKIIT